MRFALVALALACRPVQPVEPAAVPARPALVVVVVIDQLAWWTFEEARRDGVITPTGGLGRLGTDGFLGRARYPYATTSTAPGHATVSTGLTPRDHGFAGNRIPVDGVWKPIYEPTDVTTLKAPGVRMLGDAFTAAGGTVATVSLKARAACLLAGEAGDVCAPRTAAADHPWCRPPAAGTLTFEASVDGVTPPDTCVTVAPPGPLRDFGPSFPHTARIDDPATFDDTAFDMTPDSVGWAFDAALAAVTALDLGADATPDLLGISVSTSDMVAHCFSAHSAEYRSILREIDLRLAAFEAALDARGAPWVVAVTSDHGGPDHVTVHSASEMTAGLGVTWRDPWLTSDDGAPVSDAQIAAVRAWSAANGDALADVCTCGANGEVACADARFADAARASCAPRFASAALVVPAAHHTVGRTAAEARAAGAFFDASSHGSPHDYDQLVPLGFFGAGVPRGAAGTDLDPRQLAPTVAALAGIAAPNADHPGALPPVPLERR